MNCPKCNSRSTGRIGQGQYYCWDCNIEFEATDKGVRMYRLEPNGVAILENADGGAPPGSAKAKQSGPGTGTRREIP